MSSFTPTKKWRGGGSSSHVEGGGGTFCGSFNTGRLKF